MLRKLHLRLFVTASLAMLFSGCSHESMEVEGKPGYFTLKISTDAAETRADEAANPENPENKIASIDLYFYRSGSSESVAAVRSSHHVVEGYDSETVTVPLSDEDVATLFGGTNTCLVYAVVNCAETRTRNGLSINDLKELVTSAASGDGAFNQADAPATMVMFGNSNTSVGSLDSRAVTLNAEGDWATGLIPVKRVAAKMRVGFKIEPMLYLDEDGKAILPEPGESGEAYEARLAELAVEKWEPVLDGMKVLIRDGVTKARLDGTLPALQEEDYYMILDPDKGHAVTNHDVTDQDDPFYGYSYYNDTPVYSYPNKWSKSTSEPHRTYALVMIPWKIVTEEGESEAKPTYYRVPVNTLTDELLSNTYYRILANIRMLGGILEQPVVVESTCVIEPWRSEEIDVYIREYRYLTVNEVHWHLYNENSVTIPYFTSHEVVIKKVYVNYYEYFYDWLTEYTQLKNAKPDSGEGYNNGLYYFPEYFAGDYTYAMEWPFTISENAFDKTNNEYLGDDYKKMFGIDKMYTCTLDPETRTVTFTHPLIRWKPYPRVDKDLPPKGNVTYFEPELNYPSSTRFDIAIELVHADKKDDPNTQFRQTIRITQYPGAFLENSYTESTQVFVNGAKVGDKNYEWMHLKALNKFNLDQNANPNTYVINVTNFTSNDKYDDKNNYVIGDPRTLEPLSLTPTPAFINAPSVYDGENRSLQYYYPADETGMGKPGCKAFFVAPKFILSSSYGNIGEDKLTNRKEAVWACAAYQEAGRPAGRWRLPTNAEIVYMVDLARARQTPFLMGNNFTSNNQTCFWTAQGIITTRGNSGQPKAEYSEVAPKTPSARCVYDAWYWDDIDEQYGVNRSDWLTTFAWGDRPKENPQEPRDL